MAQQFQQEFIDFSYIARLGIEDQYAILGRFKKPPVAGL
jgi:hypothetical protein